MADEAIKLLQVRNFPADAYEILRRLTYERGPKATHADVIADALRALAVYGPAPTTEPQR